MLEELRLVSVGGIDRAVLSFGSGLTAVTGESGAGKSSLVRGLELLCGKRGSSSAIRSGDTSAIAEAFFSVSEPLSNLEESLQPQDGSLALRRELSRSGRGKCAIQGQTVPLNTLAETAPKLLAIQSQFAQIELLDGERQMAILDACGGEQVAQTKARLEKAFHQVLDCERKLRGVKQHEKEILSTYGAVTEIAPYLDRLKPEPDSEERLNEEYGETEHELERLRDLRGRCRRLENRDGEGVIDEISEIFEGLSELLPSDEASDIIEASQRILNDLDSVAGKLLDYAPSERIDDLESELERIEGSMGVIRKCKRLAKVATLPELIDYCREGEEGMKWLAGSAKLQAELGETAAAAKHVVVREARALHELRVQAAAALQDRVTENLRDLAMESTQFRIRVVETGKVRANGAERVEFVLLRGTQEIPVARAASGGELSRILLAIQLSLPDEIMPPTIVFDEVEAGLGGRAAYLTGLKLRSLADRVQVILITHEASIAALAVRHYLVERNGDLSTVQLIDGEARVREIARMLSGDADEGEARVHARKLLGEASAE